MQGENAQIIMFASGKGGTGKTSLCSLIGAALAQNGAKVLCIELASGPRCMDYVSGVGANVVYNLSDVFAKRCNVEKAIVKSELYNNLYAICASNEDCFIDIEIFTRFIKKLSASFNFILLDVQTGYGLPLFAAKLVAQKAMLVLTPDRLSVRAGQVMQKAIMQDGAIQTQLIINKVRGEFAHTGINNLSDIAIDTRAKLIGVVPYCNYVNSAANKGLRLPENSNSAKAFLEIAARICGIEVPLNY